jgi:hypothetical protein
MPTPYPEDESEHSTLHTRQLVCCCMQLLASTAVLWSCQHNLGQRQASVRPVQVGCRQGTHTCGKCCPCITAVHRRSSIKMLALQQQDYLAMFNQRPCSPIQYGRPWLHGCECPVGQHACKETETSMPGIICTPEGYLAAAHNMLLVQ